MNSLMNRRAFLKLAGAAGLTAATLPLARQALAQGNHPRRAIFVFVPDGMRPDQWHAQGTETNFTLPAMTQPLERVKQDCVFLSGVDMYGPGSTHEGGCAKLLTGAPGRAHDRVVSLDYYLGQQFKNLTIRPHLNLGIVPAYRDKHITFDLNGIPVMPELNPLAAFDSLFGADSKDDYLNQRRKSVLDASLAEMNALRSRLGKTEQIKLESHIDSIRELENKLVSNDGSQCKAWNFNPTGFTVSDASKWNAEFVDVTQLNVIGDLHTDVAVHALTCDLTRVVTLKWNNSVNAQVIPGSGTSKTCHQASHDGGSDFVKIKAWYNEKFAQLIEQLKSIPEGDGTLLDNTLIFLGSDLAHGNWHNHNNMPFVLAGGRAGGVQLGRSLKYDAIAHNKILVSMAQFMGVSVNRFGTEDASPSALPNLLA